MKIAILSDMHLGYERFYDNAYAQAREALEKAAESADMIIIPGDVFDKRSPKPEVIAQAINIFRDLSRREWKASVSDFRSADGRKSFSSVPIIAIAGTHERTAEGKENALGLLGLAGLLVDASEACVTVGKGEEKVCVFGLGGVAEERVKETLARLNPVPTKDAFNVFMFHQSTYELLPFSDAFIHNEDLPKGFDLYVDGHIHSRQEMTVHGKKFLIPGSTVLTQLKDGEQERKGFVLFDTSDSSHAFVSINSRRFVCRTIRIKDAKPDAVGEECEKALKEEISQGGKPIIRIVLQGNIAQGFAGGDMNVRKIVGKYSDAAYVEIDTSKLKSDEAERNIEELRESKMDGLSIREAGMRAFMENLRKQGFDGSIDAHRLFDVLSSPGKKEKVLKEANDILLT
jgi:DNA repair exonuclease SbcCD nuclease subunit